MASDVLDDESGAFGVAAHVFAKNDRLQIRVGTNEYKGHEYLDLREFYKSADGWKPSRSGLTMPPTCYPDLLRGVLELGALLGYLDGEALAAADTIAVRSDPDI